MRCSRFEVRSRLWAESRRDAVKPKEKRNHSADHRHRAAGREKASLGCQSPPFAFVRWVLPKLCMNQKLDPAKLLSHQPCPLTRPGGGRGSKTKILLSRCPHLRRGAGGEGYPWLWNHHWVPHGPGTYTLIVRATDHEGTTQPPSQDPLRLDGYEDNWYHAIHCEVC